MTAKERIRRSFMVTVREAAESNSYWVTFLPRDWTGKAQDDPGYAAMVQVQGNNIPVQWKKKPTDPEITSEDFDDDARNRVRVLREWLGRLSPLIESVDAWAKDMDWSTRRIEKPLKDPDIGTYHAPGLLLQEETTRILLEPIGRSASDTEGVVDLYLMPAYDDIASLYFYNGKWNLHYMFPGTSAVANIQEAESRPLSKETLGEVLEEMKKHAA